MTLKLVGSVLVVLACGGAGLSAAAQYRGQIQGLRSLVTALDMMSCELSYHLTPLPELCRKAADAARGPVGNLIRRLGTELEQQTLPDVTGCLDLCLREAQGIPSCAGKLLEQLGVSLGRFDLSGQLAGIGAVREQSMRQLEVLEQNREQRLRSYQTLGFCAGIALVILLI